MKSEGPNEARKNSKVFGRLDDIKEKATDTPLVPSPGVDGTELEEKGFAEKTE